MSIMRKEPAMVAGVVTAVVGLLVVYGILDETQAAAWTAVLVVVGGSPIVQGLVTRFLVFSPNTLEEAGYDPAEVQERADSEEVIPKRKRTGK